MPANIYLDLSAIIIMVMLIIALVFRKQTSGRSNMLFLALCICVLICGITDMISYYYDAVSEHTANTLLLRIVDNYV